MVESLITSIEMAEADFSFMNKYFNEVHSLVSGLYLQKSEKDPR